MKRLISVLLSVLFFVGCSGTLYSHKRIPIKLDKISAGLYGANGVDLAIDIERCKSDTDECSKILLGLHNGNINIEGVNWDNFEIIIKEK